ncbi:class I SAM-dependent methyltransferase [Pseudarthrobacter sp. WHRI 8279]|uniref:class I SAM-dependent methyltransferase n=1 Tax=Pseudarthrobacter sp. WHRI 8279 TaxID=3162566 RepID=UPI0035A96EEA
MLFQKDVGRVSQPWAATMRAVHNDPPGPTGSCWAGGLQHPRFARAYARAVEGMNRGGVTEHRWDLLSSLYGRVVEIGAGAGSAFALYPATVTEVLAVEPDDYLRALAASRAVSAPVPVIVVAGAAEAVPAADASADAVVTSLVLCSVVEQSAALAEARRVLRPGGVLAFYEHVRSDMGSLPWRRTS